MRLIDADALIEVLQNEPKYSIELPANMGDAIKKLLNVHQKMVVEVVKKQPTAYDPEKVVAELEEEQRKDIEDAKFYRDTKNEKLCIAYTNKARAYKDAIEIVRKGGAT